MTMFYNNRKVNDVYLIDSLIRLILTLSVFTAKIILCNENYQNKISE